MALPKIIDIAHQHLFSDIDRMKRDGLPEPTVKHIVRLRDGYTYWLNFPSKRDRDIVAHLKQSHGIGDTAARDDLRLIKTLLGDMNKSTKDYHRYRFNQMIQRAYDKADAQNNTRDMVAAASQYAKYNQLDKEDERANIIDRVVPVVLRFTDNPEVIGIKPIPNIREKIKKMKEKYWAEETVDVDYEEIDAQLDDIFTPKLQQLPNAEGTTASVFE